MPLSIDERQILTTIQSDVTQARDQSFQILSRMDDLRRDIDRRLEDGSALIADHEARLVHVEEKLSKTADAKRSVALVTLAGTFTLLGQKLYSLISHMLGGKP